MMGVFCNLASIPKLFRTACPIPFPGCVTDEAVMDAGSGLLFRCVSIQLHLKGALKLEMMAHLLQA